MHRTSSPLRRVSVSRPPLGAADLSGTLRHVSSAIAPREWRLLFPVERKNARASVGRLDAKRDSGNY